ncbi:MAG: response regulator transcription factor [Pseudonocardiaceae bacterium]
MFAAPSGATRQLVSDALSGRGARVVAVHSLSELRNAVERLRPDVVIVDVGIAVDCWDILLQLVRNARIALIAVAVHDPAARVELLLAGADDCLPASYALEELTARVIAIVRRTYRATTPPEAGRILDGGAIHLDMHARRAEVRGSEVFLTAREFDLLSCFMRHAGETLPRDRLLTEVWGYTFGSAETVTVHVRRLRTKVESDPSRPELIQTVWGIGYRFGRAENTPITAMSTDQEHGRPVP